MNPIRTGYKPQRQLSDYKFNKMNLAPILLSYTNLRNITTHVINKQLPIQGLYYCSDSNPTTYVASIVVVAATQPMIFTCAPLMRQLCIHFLCINFHSQVTWVSLVWTWIPTWDSIIVCQLNGPNMDMYKEWK